MNPLSKLSDDELENNLGINIQNERKSLHIVLEHIREVVRRDLHLARGFSSVKKYLMAKYAYSEPAARRRAEAAQILKDVPVLAEKIQTGSICLSVVGELKRAIKEKENTSREKVSAQVKTELVEMIAGKSVEETQQKLAQALDIQIKDYEHQRVQKDESVRLEITVSKDAFEKLQQCRDLLGQHLQQEHKNHTLASVIELLAENFIEKKTKVTPTRSPKVINSNVSRKDFSNTQLETGSNHEHKDISPNSNSNKTLTPKTKREILDRDKCCQFKDPQTGKICGSTFNLQTDHKTSQWAGGDHSHDNLQILCANHNRYKYRQEAQLRWL